MRLRTILAAGTVMASVGFAAPALAAYATTAVNVRATPGGAIVDVLRQGEQASIVRRSGNWCAVNKAGPDGWVACRYLADDRRGYRDRDYNDRRYRRGPDVGISFSVPGFGVRIGDDDRRDWRDRRSWDERRDRRRDRDRRGPGWWR